MRVLALLLLITGATRAHAEVLDHALLDAEVGPVRIFQNEGRYGAKGTLFRAGDLGESSNLFSAERIAVEFQKSRSILVFLYAPFDLHTQVTLTRDVQFRGLLLRAGTPISNRYLFDGYRGSYLYRVVEGRRFKLELGASLQVRNASVEFGALDGSSYERQTNIGLVFALKGRVRYDFTWGGWAMLDADGISSFGVGGVGGALYDVALTLGLPVRTGADLFFRLRFLGGGANVPDQRLYNWGKFGFALIGARLDFTELWRR